MTNKMTCAPSEDSAQAGHPPSLIRVFDVRINKVWVLSYPVERSAKTNKTGRMPGARHCGCFVMLRLN